MDKTQLAGAVILISGILVIAGYMLQLFIRETEIPLEIRVGITAIFSGFIIILLSLVRERIMDIQKEKSNSGR
jgi:hypothetical protein